MSLVANSLGLDDDLDAVVLVQNLEKAFEIGITDAEAESVLTVGQLYDLLLAKIPANESDRRCASAMVFYRLRRALENRAKDTALTPSTSLLFLEEGRARTTVKELEKETGLRLPELELTGRGYFGCLSVLVAFCAAMGISSFYHLGYFSGLSGFVAVVTFVALEWAILRLDPGKLPIDCSTLGGLATRVAALNYGFLIKVGASHCDREIWKSLLELLSGYALSKSEINRDTYFLQSQLRKAS